VLHQVGVSFDRKTNFPYDRSCQEKFSYWKLIRSVMAQKQKLQENFTRQYGATIQRAIPVRKHNYPYQIGKTEVPQHQPQYDNGTHS